MAYINGKQIMNCNVTILQAEITFTIDGVEYKAMYGMTWGEWCNSRYNTTGFYIFEGDGTLTAENGDSVSLNDNGIYQARADHIIGGGIYITV